MDYVVSEKGDVACLYQEDYLRGEIKGSVLCAEVLPSDDGRHTGELIYLKDSNEKGFKISEFTEAPSETGFGMVRREYLVGITPSPTSYEYVKSPISCMSGKSFFQSHHWKH